MIEMGKEYKTREGKPVRLYTVNGANASQPVVGERHIYDDAWGVSTWDTQGRWTHDGAEHKYDLIEVKPVLVVDGWLNTYKDIMPVFHLTRRSADEQASPGRLSCLRIHRTYREGDGLCDSEKT